MPIHPHDDLRIGTMAGGEIAPEFIRQVGPHGFESYQINFWTKLGPTPLPKLAERVLAECEKLEETLGFRPVVSSLAPFGNPLQEPGHAEMWEACIDAAEAFGCSHVCGFAGALEDRPVDGSMGRFKEVFGPLAERARDKGVRLAFENCDMGGTWQHPEWNIAHAPRAWEMMFDALDDDSNVGLLWEPCHQMVSLIDPLPQLRKWIDKVFHVHGKDATVRNDLIRTEGIRSGLPLVEHRTPGFGDTNWTDLISILRQGKFEGFIDIEGYHDPVYRGDREMTGQVHALQHLQRCRGGAFVPNPVLPGSP